MNWMMGGANSELQYALIICQHCPNLEELDSNSLVYNFHFGSQLKVRNIGAIIVILGFSPVILTQRPL